MPATLQQIVKDICQRIQAAAQVLKAGSGKGEKPAATRPELKATLDRAAEGLKGEVAKCALLWQAGEPSVVEAESLLSSLQQRVMALCAGLTWAQVQSGPTLTAELYRLANGVTSACSTFLKGAASPQAARLAGVVMERCDAVKRAPLDNRTAIGRSILNIIAQIRDVLRETSELEQSLLGAAPASIGDSEGRLTIEQTEQCAAASSNNHSRHELAEGFVAEGFADAGMSRAHLRGENGGGEEAISRRAVGEEDSSIRCTGGELGSRVHNGADSQPSSESGSVADVDFEAQAATPAEVDVITAAKDLLDALVRMLKGVMRLTVQQPADLGGNCEAWESVLFHCKNLVAPGIDLGAGLYSPQEQEELESAADAIATGAEVLVGDVPVQHDLSSKLQADADRLAIAHAKLLEYVQKI